MPDKVDCIINVCKKPFQTTLALLSLNRYSGKYIDKIFFIEENLQNDPEKSSSALIKNRLPNLEYYIPKYWLWTNPIDVKRLGEDEYRSSIRYQYGWEKSNKDFIFITHNDCIYHDDIIGAFLKNIGDNIAIGSIGQCWNCPAFWTKKCNSNNYWNYRPSFVELSALYETVEPPSGHTKRPYHIPKFHEQFKNNPWPLPECRVNEWCILINLAIARDLTVPRGIALPFGAMVDGGRGTSVLDIAVGWFRDISIKNFRCKNFPIYDYMHHTGGHLSMFNFSLYRENENNALKILRTQFV